MPPNTGIVCTFFARGFCKNGDSCRFIHEPPASAWPPQRHLTSGSNAYQHPLSEQPLPDSRSIIPCKFLSRPGGCRNGACPFLHALDEYEAEDSKMERLHLGRQDDDSSGQGLSASDSRARVPCKFQSRPGGCRKEKCPFLHAAGAHDGTKTTNEEDGLEEDEDQERDDDFSRELLGASVGFDDFGQVQDVSLPTDFSLVSITGFAPGMTSKAATEIIRRMGFDVSVDCVRVTQHMAPPGTRATVKVRDPLFASEFSAFLKHHESQLTATQIPANLKQANCRKVYVSWHKATKSAWVNFGSGEIADRVSKRFNEGSYKCLGYSIKSSTANRSPGRGGWRHSTHNPVSWTITLSDVPGEATAKDIEAAIRQTYDKPRHVELGIVSYQASDAEVSVEVRSALEDHGPLESFHLAPASKGKRVKATAWFQNEADARAACSLNNTSLHILGKGRLTIALVHSVKMKVSTEIYTASKNSIEVKRKVWEEKHLSLRIYPDPLNRFTTLKLESNDEKDVSDARKTLDVILSGITLTNGKDIIWDPSLHGKGSAYKRLKAVEKEFSVVITRDQSKRELRYHGPSERLQQTASRISDLLKGVPSTCHEINLTESQFSRVIQGGFKSIVEVLGKNVAVFDVVSRKVIINGIQQQYEMALAVLDGKSVAKPSAPSDLPSGSEGDCPICLCEADSPIQASCKHIYCQDCFEESCKSAASTSKDLSSTMPG